MITTRDFILRGSDFCEKYSDYFCPDKFDGIILIKILRVIFTASIVHCVLWELHDYLRGGGIRDKEIHEEGEVGKVIEKKRENKRMTKRKRERERDRWREYNM